jgi:hypothetical protein
MGSRRKEMKRLLSLIIIILLCGPIFSTFTQRGEAQGGLVGYWNFDEGSGTIAYDSSGNNNHGTLNNGPIWVNGKFGKALSFDGVDDYVQISQSSSLDVTSQVTVEAWVYPNAYVDSTGMTGAIISRTHLSGGHIYMLSIYPDSHKASYSVNPIPWEHSSDADLPLNTWTHLAMTYDGVYVRLYMNGALDSSYPLSEPIQTTSNWLAFGCIPCGPHGGVGTYAYFNGMIDDVRIYNRALSQQEIQTDMEALPSPRDLVAKPMISSINLKWATPDKLDVQRYYIFRGASPDFEISWPNYYATVDGSTLQFIDSVSEDAIYYYKVVASYPEGFSVPSDAVACARLESFKGIANDLVGTSTLTVLDSWKCITFQQNFFINTSDAGGNRKYYWCQNCVVKTMNPRLGLPIAPKGYATAWMYVWGPIDSIQQPYQDTPKISKPDWPDWKFCPDEIKFSSYIDGSSLVMHNSLWGPQRFNLGLSPDAYIHTITTDYPPDSTMLDQYNFPPNFVLVGDLNGGHANFTSGTGLVSCRTKIGDYWHPGMGIAVVDFWTRNCATGETSEGLSWDTHGYFNSQVHSFHEGVFFVPDFDTPVIGPLTFNTVSNSACVLTVQAKCPVYLKLYDNLGRFIGFDATSGSVEAQIPTAVWRSNQSICIFDPSGTYYLMVVGIESGTYTLQISWQNETGCLILCNSTETIGKDDSPSWILSSTASGSYVVMENTPLSVSINPLSGSTLVGQSVTFTSTVSGGIPPYIFQWYLNGNPVLNATSNAWTFTPATSGIYYVYLKVTDSGDNTKLSETARITVATVPVGGYSTPIQGPATAKTLTPYLILTTILTIAFTTIKRKTTRKTKRDKTRRYFSHCSKYSEKILW